MEKMKFKVKKILHQTVARDCWYPNVLSDGKGTLAMGLRRKPDGVTLYSHDYGLTWQEKTDNVMGFIPTVLPDGSILGFGMLNMIQDHVRRSQTEKPFIAMMRRATSLSALLDGNYVDDFVKVRIPDLVGNVGDADDYALGTIDHGIVQLADRRLLMTMYGRFKGDNVNVAYYGHGAYQFRTWVCESTDDGESWHYLQTIAANDRAPLPEISEGYCEADLISLRDGTLLAAMRTGGCSLKGSTERYTPLYACRSLDAGSNWLLPTPVFDYGVWPRLLEMSNGIVVCASGRPGVFLLFSLDGGVTWSEPEYLSRFDDDWSRCASGYNSICELKPGELTLFYDDVDPADDNRIHETKMVTLAVSSIGRD